MRATRRSEPCSRILKPILTPKKIFFASKARSYKKRVARMAASYMLIG
jgi:hypothetical protein